jgi:hypothetical protein
MPTISDIGAEVSEVPFGDFIANVATGIAAGQTALDLASLQTLRVLSQTMVDVIPEVTEVITPDPFTVQVPDHDPVTVTGARVTGTPGDTVQMSALQAGILPSFYQFTTANIALKLSVQMRQATETDSDGNARSILLALGSHVNFRTQNTFSYSADASSAVTVTMAPVPPPSRLVPSTVTVNALGPGTPSVTISP